MTEKYIAFQGDAGAYSEEACRTYAPHLTPLPCATFDEVFAKVENGDAEEAMVPIENSVAGRVSDIHHLLPDTELTIIAEYFLPIQHQIMIHKDANEADIKYARSHQMALGQVRNAIKALNLIPQAAGDTAGAAKELSEMPQMDVAVVASKLAAEIYDLRIIKADVADENHNTTRFLRMQHEMPEYPDEGTPDMLTSFMFEVGNIPAALYKAMGGFATNNVNMLKLESYQKDGQFTSTRFYAEIMGHPYDANVRRALQELGMFSPSHVKILGVYPMSDFRKKFSR